MLDVAIIPEGCGTHTDGRLLRGLYPTLWLVAVSA